MSRWTVANLAATIVGLFAIWFLGCLETPALEAHPFVLMVPFTAINVLAGLAATKATMRFLLRNEASR